MVTPLNLDPRLTHPNLELELTPNQVRELVDLAVDHITTFIQTLPDQVAYDLTGADELARRFKEPLPERAEDAQSLLDRLFEEAVPVGFNTAGPGHLGYIPGGGLPHAAVADLIANVINRYVGIWMGAPGLVQLETNVIRWFCEMMGYPEQSLGILTSGGSLANFSAVVTARKAHLPENFLLGTIYGSDQTHHSIEKAAMLAGFPPKNVRKIPAHGGRPISIDALVKSIQDDRAAGWQPFMVVGNAGSTNTGAVDDLNALAKVAAQERLWLHVDAAYGGFFMLTEAGRNEMAGLEKSDSITLDPHKGMFLPYGTGALLVRDRETLARAHSHGADYLPKMQEDPDFVDYCELSPELTRDFRGLRVWLPLKLHGIQPFRDNLEEKLALTRWVTEELRKVDHIEIVSEPQLSIMAFRLTKPGLDTEALNALNHELIERVLARRHVILSGTLLGELYVVRICILSFRTHLDRVGLCVDDIKAVAAELLD